MKAAIVVITMFFAACDRLPLERRIVEVSFLNGKKDTLDLMVYKSERYGPKGFMLKEGNLKALKPVENPLIYSDWATVASFVTGFKIIK